MEDSAGTGRTPAGSGTAFAAITMMANCVENAAILAYINGGDVGEILEAMNKLRGALSTQCPCPCGSADGDLTLVAFEPASCGVTGRCGDGFKCNEEGECVLDLPGGAERH